MGSDTTSCVGLAMRVAPFFTTTYPLHFMRVFGVFSSIQEEYLKRIATEKKNEKLFTSTSVRRGYHWHTNGGTNIQLLPIFHCRYWKHPHCI